MLQNCFIDFAVEHRFVRHIAEPGYTEEIGAEEIWLIDWSVDAEVCGPLLQSLFGGTFTFLIHTMPLETGQGNQIECNIFKSFHCGVNG